MLFSGGCAILIDFVNRYGMNDREKQIIGEIDCSHRFDRFFLAGCNLQKILAV
jgi:hypothetical protein